MCETIVNIYCTFCGAGYCHGNALYADLGDGGKLAQELGEPLDAMQLELAGLGVSPVGLESQCNWVRLQTLVPSWPVERGHLFTAYHVQGTVLSLRCALLHFIFIPAL